MRGRDHNRPMRGTRREEAAGGRTAAGADVVGANCGQGAEGYVGISKRLRAVTDRPLWMKPNAGLPVVSDGNVHYDMTPQAFARHAQSLVEAGAGFVGGCCGTAPEFIRELAARL